MANSQVCCDTKFSSVEVTDYLKIPFCSEKDASASKDREIKFNQHLNCLQIKTSSGWKYIKAHTDIPVETKIIETVDGIPTTLGSITIKNKAVFINMNDVFNESTFMEDIAFVTLAINKKNIKKIKLTNTPTHKDNIIGLLKSTKKYRYKINKEDITIKLD